MWCVLEVDDGVAIGGDEVGSFVEVCEACDLGVFWAVGVIERDGGVVGVLRSEGLCACLHGLMRVLTM